MDAARSRGRPPYLIRRGDTFHLRVRVPRDLMGRIGLSEVRRSLGVGRLSEARLLGPLYAARVKEAFKMIRVGDLARDQGVALVRDCFRDLAGEVDGVFQPGSSEPELDIAEQEHHSDEALRDLERQIKAGTPDAQSATLVARLMAEHGIAASEGPDPMQAVLNVGVLRALAEQQRLFQYRLREPLLPYVPLDPLFCDMETVKPGLSAPFPSPPPSTQQVGPRIGELVERYLQAKRVRWTPKTHRTNQQKLTYLVQHIGPDRFATSVQTEDIRTYRDGLLRLRRNHHVGPGSSFVARQTEAQEHRISAKTALLLLEAAKTFFRWAKAEGYVSFNPAEHITIEPPKTVKGEKPRRPFRDDELKRLFSAPPFTGCLSIHRRLQAGSRRVRDAYFWIPVLAYYSGLRLGEIVQLHLGDVHVDGPIPYVSVNEENGGALGSGEEKHVKSEAGVRQVPLHPDLISLGFDAFIARRIKDHKARKRLFWEIGYGSDGQPSSLFSKWFARLLDKVELSDPALVFHSFRHGIEDAFRNSLAPEYVIDRIVGHADGKVSSQYGQGVSLEVAYEAVKALKLPVSLVGVVQ